MNQEYQIQTINNSATHGRWSYPEGRDQPKPTEVVDIIVRQYNVVKIKTDKKPKLVRVEVERQRGREEEKGIQARLWTFRG